MMMMIIFIVIIMGTITIKHDFFFSLFHGKDVDSTSGSGPESFYTPQPSPTDSSSSGKFGDICCLYFIIGHATQ